MQYLIPYFGLDNLRAMIFVDGENLAIRFAAQIKKQSLEKQSLSQRPKVSYPPHTPTYAAQPGVPRDAARSKSVAPPGLPHPDSK